MNAPKNSNRILVVGYGGMGRMYARAIRNMSRLAGVVVGREESRRRLEDELEEAVFTDMEDALQRAKPTAVAIFSPTDWHGAHLRCAMDHGLPALVIKPLCVSVEEAEKLHREALEMKARVLMAHEGVFAPAFLALEGAIRDGRIGRVQEIRWVKEGQESLSGGREKEAPRREDLEGRNFGHIYASAMHELYVANRLAGGQHPQSATVSRVFASSNAMKLDAVLEYSNEIILRLRYNLGEGLPFRRGLQVVGDDGALLWMMEEGKTLLQLRRGKTVEDLGYRGSAGGPAADVLSSFLEFLQGGPSNEGLLDGARALRGARQLTRSAAEHEGIEVDMEALAGGLDQEWKRS